MYIGRKNMDSAKDKNKRCDSEGRAFAGSQRQIQFYVNQEAAMLGNEISQALQVKVSPRWVSPMHTDMYREYRDAASLRALGLDKHQKELALFWPSRGPVWDALALDDLTGGVLLLEAKSHVPEICGSGCKAKADRSIQKIEQSMAATKTWLDIPQGIDWMGDLYQSANRIAHLYFFREILRIPAWLVNVYFIDDPHSPTTQAKWDGGIKDVKKRLGFNAVPFSADIFLPANG
jgi:hypothetical protein